MSMLEKIDWFSASLPKKCIYCAYGYPIVFGTTDWLDMFVCGRSCITNLRTKKENLSKNGYKTDSDYGKASIPWYVAIVEQSDSCDGFKPIRLDGKGNGFVNARKFYLLDKAGLFDDMECKPDVDTSIDKQCRNAIGLFDNE